MSCDNSKKKIDELLNDNKKDRTRSSNVAYSNKTLDDAISELDKGNITIECLKKIDPVFCANVAIKSVKRPKGVEYTCIVPDRSHLDLTRGRSIEYHTKLLHGNTTRGHSRGSSRGHSRGSSRGHSRESNRGHSRGSSRGHSSNTNGDFLLSQGSPSTQSSISDNESNEQIEEKTRQFEKFIKYVDLAGANKTCVKTGGPFVNAVNALRALKKYKDLLTKSEITSINLKVNNFNTTCKLLYDNDSRDRVEGNASAVLKNLKGKLTDKGGSRKMKKRSTKKNNKRKHSTKKSRE